MIPVNSEKNGTKEIKKPRQYQKEIVRKAVAELSRQDRATVIMPCGSGKTLVALWIIERMEAKTVVVFAPTLGLLAQTAREFLANTRYRQVAYLAVCSDNSVVKGLDEIRPAPEEFPFSVTAKAGVVQNFLERNNEARVKFLFCTYQSSDILGAALLRSGIRLDLAFFDEAHRTAGKFGAPFTYTLSNEKLPARKRLFMTATLRAYESSGTAQLKAYSMDNKVNYGKVCAKMSFAEAVETGIICPYKVIVSVADTSSLQLKQIDNGVVKGEDISAREAAIRESLLQALTKYGIKKVISYHTTIEQASEFASKVLPNAADAYAYEILHINSKMTGKQRHETMERFRQAERAIITNAHCLTEGIDVPAVDMVVFADPKYSEIDIIQAIGRVMRMSENKAAGYVFLPLFMPKNSGESIESIAEGLSRSRFEIVWNVLNALCSLDEGLEGQMAFHRQNLGLDGMVRELGTIEILAPFGVDAQKIQESIGIFIIRQLSDLWEEFYGQLLHFQQEHGHIAVPYATPLGKWIAFQRLRWNILALKKQERLLKLGFDPNPRETRWRKKFEEILLFKMRHGHIRVSSTPLQNWLKHQRKRWNILPSEKRESLLELGFEPDPIGTFWQKRLEELSAYAQEHGHCNVKRNENEALSTYLKEIRQAYREGRLAPERIADFEKLGMLWGDKKARLFEDTCRQMAVYRQEHGGLPPTNTRLRQERILIGRMIKLRVAYRAGELNGEQIRRLRELGFSFEPDEERWQKRYGELKEYVAKSGNPNRIPSGHRLANWVCAVKVSYRNGHLSQEKIDLLEKIGVSWDDAGRLNELWKSNYQSVAEYFRKNGINSLPAAHPVYGWWKIQLKNVNELPPEKAEEVRALKPLRLRHRWSEREKTIVFENPGQSPEELAKRLIGRTPQSVQTLRDKYGW
jgi:superfamily II DNA or RNA helicase